LKASREKQHNAHKVTTICFMIDFSSETTEVRKQQNNVFKILSREEETVTPAFSIK